MTQVKISELPHVVGPCAASLKQFRRLEVMLEDERLLLESYAAVLGFKVEGWKVNSLYGGSAVAPEIILAQAFKVRQLEGIIAASRKVKA